ncbi:MAG: LysR family transcriptional regulator [Chloroflexi bacterium]|nr:LysR family transcriptional regulator [Chloroflexota bacterium]
MNLRHLEVFCTVVQCESFSGAAEQLYMTQPAVSMQVQAVERHFGVQLLERRSRRVILTLAGESAHRWAREVLASEADTRKHVDELIRAETGRIVLGTTMALGSHVLPQIIHRFKRDHPGAEIVVRLADRQEVGEEALAGTIDVGVHLAVEVPAGLDVEIVGKERLVFVCAPSHPLAHRARVTISELAAEAFVLPPKGFGFRKVTDMAMAEHGLGDVRVLMEVGVGESIKSAVEEGVGVGLLMHSMVAMELERGYLCEIESPNGPPMVDLVLVRRPRREISPMLEAFIAVLREGLREHSERTQNRQSELAASRVPEPVAAQGSRPV